MSSPEISENKPTKPEEVVANKEMMSCMSTSEEPKERQPTQEINPPPHEIQRTEGQTLTSKLVDLDLADTSFSYSGLSSKETKCLVSGMAHLTLPGQSSEASAKSEFTSSLSTAEKSELSDKLKNKLFPPKVCVSSKKSRKKSGKKSSTPSSAKLNQAKVEDKLEVGELSPKLQSCRPELQGSFLLGSSSSLNTALHTDELKSEEDQLTPKLLSDRKRMHSSLEVDPFEEDRAPSPNRLVLPSMEELGENHRLVDAGEIKVSNFIAEYIALFPLVEETESDDDSRSMLLNFLRTNYNKLQYRPSERKNKVPILLKMKSLDLEREKSKNERLSEPSVKEEQPMDTSSTFV